jgi:Ca-activated chloride channel family protein
MKFSHPGWLAAGIVSCLGLIWLWRRHDSGQYAALARFVSAHLRAQLTQSVSVARRRAQRGLMLAALGLLFIALAGPLVGFRWEQINRRGNDIVIAVDTSRSMSTPDVKPDRLTRAKLAIDDFTRKLEGDAVGLVAFAGDAFLVCPITLDYGAFHESLNAIDTDIIPRGGTNIASAIHEAQAALRRRPGSDKILILVTDGEDLEGDALIAAQAAAREDSLKIYTIGVGTAQGDLIPVSADRGSGFVKDDSGAFVKSRLDEDALKAIATASGGMYAPLGAQGQGFETIYQARLAPLLKHDLASRQQRVYIERYQWPLAGSLTLLLLSQLIGNRRRVRRPQRAPASESRTAAGATALSALVLRTRVAAARHFAGRFRPRVDHQRRRSL